MPCLFTERRTNGDEIGILRIITTINREEGTIGFWGTVKEGWKIKLVLMDKEKISNSVQLAMERLKKTHSKDITDKYSVVLFTACMSHYMNYNIFSETDIKKYYHEMNEEIEIIGMYSAGEFYPHYHAKSNENYNVFHNAAITMLAL